MSETAAKKSAPPTPPTIRTPKRTTEEQLTDTLKKLLAHMEDRLAGMKQRKAECNAKLAELVIQIPELEKKIAAQRAALNLQPEMFEKE